MAGDYGAGVALQGPARRYLGQEADANERDGCATQSGSGKNHKDQDHYPKQKKKKKKKKKRRTRSCSF